MAGRPWDLRDVGLSLQRLAADGGSSGSKAGAPWLRCGRLVRCCGAPLSGKTFEELRRPGTVVSLSADDAPLDRSLEAQGVVVLRAQADGRLDPFDVGDREVQAWLQDVVRALGKQDLAFPVLLHCRSGAARVSVVVAMLLLLLGVPEPAIVREFNHAAGGGAEEARLQKVLAGFHKAGGAKAYLSKARRRSSGEEGADEETAPVDAEQVRASFAAATAEEEVRWLQQESQLLCKLSRAAAKRTRAEADAEADHWRREAAAAGRELSRKVPPAEAAAALYCRGWALAQLPRRKAEAKEALTLGIALGRVGGAKAQVMQLLEKELEQLPWDEEEGEELDRELTVFPISSAADVPGNPYAQIVVLQLAAGETSESTTSAAWPFWRALPCPRGFAWLRCGELAASATPEAQHLPTLDALGLGKGRVLAEALGADRASPPLGHWEKVVDQAAKAIAEHGCGLIHCGDGFGATGIALACFAVVHGLDDPVRPGKPGQPKMTAGEAIEVVRALRPGCLADAAAEEHVQSFAVDAWAKHIERTQRAFSRPMGAAGTAAGASSAKPASSPAAKAPAASAQAPAAPPASRMAPATAKVVKQPGDGNCLFHSLSYGLGQGTAATLRGEICTFMEKNPDLTIAGTSLAEWIQMLAGSPVVQYARKMAKGSQWGGAPEIAACAHMRQVNVHVYERRAGGFELTVPFDVPSAKKTVSVLYVGGVHYDALVL